MMTLSRNIVNKSFQQKWMSHLSLSFGPACGKIPILIRDNSDARLEYMKKQFVTLLAAVSAMIILTSCVAVVGDKPTWLSPRPTTPTLGQQLSDLQKARDDGAISEADFEAQKAKLLGK
jgi:hypothetical protein